MTEEEIDSNNYSNSSKVCQQAAQVQQHTLDALQRIHLITAEAETIGMTTLEELHAQRAQLENILEAGDRLQEQLDTTEKLQNSFGVWNLELFSNLQASKKEAKQEIKARKAKQDLKTERTLRLGSIAASASVAPQGPDSTPSLSGSSCSSTSSSSSKSTVSTTAAVMSKSSVSTSAAIVVEPHGTKKNSSHNYYYGLSKLKKSKKPSEMLNEYENQRKGLLYGIDTAGHENEHELLALAETDDVIDKEMDAFADSLDGLLNMSRSMNAEMKAQDAAMDEVEKSLSKAEYKMRTANERGRRYLSGKPRVDADRAKILGIGF